MMLPVTELQAFVRLAELLHFGRTADALHVTQPALTKQIQRLEELVGGALVVRGYRAVRLTPAGQVLLPRARMLLQESAATLDAAQRAARGQLGVLRIGFGLATIQKLLPRLLLRFRSRLPDVEIRLRDMSTPAQVAAIVSGELDVGFVRLPVSEPQVAARPLLRERLVALLGPNAQWQSRQGLQSVARDPFVTIARTTSASFHDHVITVCRAAGFTPRIVQETNELFTMMMLVEAGMGVALAPSSTAIRRPAGVRVKPVTQPEAEWDIGIAWNQKRADEPLVNAFVAAALQLGRLPRTREVDDGASPPDRGTP
jgi:DNA-binding transcriptional LysR family regulator